MKFLFAPDSFKGSVSAVEATQLLAQAALAHFPQAQCVPLPVADGGEGTVEALKTALGGEDRAVRVKGPLGDEVQARYAALEGGAVALEVAQASGLALLSPDALDPMNASSYGTGELLLHALRAGAREVFIGIGGSATNDGGMGMLRALGARFYDEGGRELAGCGADLARVARADVSGACALARSARIRVLCDVSNPLLGENGATAVYGPQKGATRETARALEAGMANYARVVGQAVGRDVASFPGAGAAGGLGAALAGVLGAELSPGIDAVLDAMRFDRHLEGADLVVTGEGRIDRQSVAFGKAPTGVARRCAARGVPVVAMVGGMGEGAQQFCQIGQAMILPIVNGPMPLAQAMENARALFFEAAGRLFALLKMGAGLPGGARANEKERGG